MSTTYGIQQWGSDKIDPFPHQARKIFRDDDIEKLIDSIREHGIIQPLIARPSPGNAQRLQLVAGERRLRAARYLKLADVPVIVRQLSDDEAEEIALIENLARVNLSPVEEANAFKRMLQLKSPSGSALYTQASLAAKIGRKEWEIKDALKMLEAPEALLQAIDAPEGERKVSVSIAPIIGRIPDVKAREEAARDVLKGRQLNGGPATGVPLTYAQSVELVRREYMERITLSKAEQGDADLVPVKHQTIEGIEVRVFGGACVDCPFRSGCMKDLGGALQAATSKGSSAGVDPNICTKPACQRAKRDALWEKLKEQHLKDGGRVLSAADAKKELYQDGGVRYDSEYALLTESPSNRHQRLFPGRYSLPAWKKLLKGLEFVITLARSEKGDVVKLINAKECAELIRVRWKEEPSDADAKEVAKQKEARAKELRAEKIDKALVHLGLGRIEVAITSKGLDIDQWKQFFGIVLGNAGADAMAVLGSWKQIKLPKRGHGSGRDFEEEIGKIIDGLPSINAVLAWCVLTNVARSTKYAGAGGSDFKEALAMLGIDIAELKREATAEIDAALSKSKRDKAKEKPAKRPPHDGMGAFDEGQSGAKVKQLKAKTGDGETVYEGGDEADLDPVMDIVNRKRASKVKKPMTRRETRAALNSKLDAMNTDWQAEWDALPKKPAKGTPAFKTWDAKRKKIKYQAEKAGITLKTKGE